MENITNIFETKVGVMNIAPTKISGQYKIVVDKFLNLWLDDYTGRRVKVDKSISFLGQVSNFLKVKTTIIDMTSLRYGGFQKSNVKSYHIPFYFNKPENLPKYFVLNRVVNEEIKDPSFLYKYSQLLLLVDLQKIGLFEIFQEIDHESAFDYPLYFNFEENKINLYGFSIDKNIPSIYTMDIFKSVVNQPYIDVLNNKILNTFQQQNIFFPRFLNIEFEFEYSNNYVAFNNFYGYLSNYDEINSISESYQTAKIRDFKDHIEFYELNICKPFIAGTFEEIKGSVSIQQIANQNAQYRYRINRVEIGDSIKIVSPNENVELDYVVKGSDIKSTLFQSLISIGENASKQSDRNFLFTPIDLSKYGYCDLIISTVSNDIYAEDYTITAPQYYKVQDRDLGANNYFKFRGIKDIDVWLMSNPKSLLVGDLFKYVLDHYLVVEKFGYMGCQILRLNKILPIQILTQCDVVEINSEKIIELKPINFLSYNSKLKSQIPYNIEQYANELRATEGVLSVNMQAINDFSARPIDPSYEYITEVNGNLIDTPEISVIDSNNVQVLNMMFCSMGCNSYITPNILNIDKQFFTQNGCTDIDLKDRDLMRFNWFLIKGKCPNYIKNDVRSLRYFTDTPKLTSRLVKVNYAYCETIFLGVKYQLPQEYTGFQFATYLNFNNQEDHSLNYKYEIDLENKTIFLSINKYLDFINLIRTSALNNEPLLDLSFFYNISKMYNSGSTYADYYQSGGIELCPKISQENDNDYIPLNDLVIKDWKYKTLDNEWLIAVRRNIDFFNQNDNNFKSLFPTTGDVEFYMYNEVMYNGILYFYRSMTVKLIDIRILSDNYLWCTDIKVKFFDTDQIFLQKFNGTDEDTILVSVSDISSIHSKNNNIFGDFVKEVVINNQGNSELMLQGKEISLKEYYFEVNQVNGAYEVFKFPEFFKSDWTDAQIIEQFVDADLDLSVSTSQITLFDRNQIWKTILEVCTDKLSFNYLTKNQIITKINEFLPIQLKKFTDSNSIQIKDSTDIISTNIIDIDKNVTIWKYNSVPKLTLINRFRTVYLPYLENSIGEFDFQLPEYKKYGTLFNIYDKNFAGTGLTATTFYNEVKGNIISSLFCKDEIIKISVPYSKSTDYEKLFIGYFKYEESIITGNNEAYIAKITSNIDKYILDSFGSMIFINYYKLSTVQNELGKNLRYTTTNTSNCIINETTLPENLVFIFVRK